MNIIVSIIIPVFNREQLISETLNCIINQTYSQWECILVDDGSSDNSISIINSYIDKDDRFKLYVRPIERLKGASTCRNIGIENSIGKFIQFLDSDDLLSSNKIYEQVELLRNETENVIATCKWGRFNKEINDAIIFENLETYNFFDDSLLFLNSLSRSKGYFPPNAYLIKADIVKKVGLWNEYISINDDGEFMMRIIANTDKIYFASEAIAFYRHTDSQNLSSFNNKQNVNETIYSWKLIDSYLKIRYKTDNIYYVEVMKYRLFKRVKETYPELISKHNFFFKDQLVDYKLSRRIKDKVKRVLSKLLKN